MGAFLDGFRHWFQGLKHPKEAAVRLCVRWEDPEDHSNGALLLEPRFLTPAVDNTLLTAKRRSQVAGSTTRSLAFSLGRSWFQGRLGAIFGGNWLKTLGNVRY